MECEKWHILCSNHQNLALSQKKKGPSNFGIILILAVNGHGLILAVVAESSSLPEFAEECGAQGLGSSQEASLYRQGYENIFGISKFSVDWWNLTDCQILDRKPSYFLSL